MHSIAVCLDDFGPAVLMLEALVGNGTLTQTQLPWVVSLHDLLVCADMFDDPGPFLTYLRRRTSRDAALWVTGVDELDILMWFIAGGFYFEPDPDRLHAHRTQGRPPTAKDRRRYAEQGRTVVGTFTDDLDAWYYGQEGSSSRTAPRPRRTMDPQLRMLSDGLRDAEAPGWWRIGADLDDLAEQAQHRLAEAMRLTISRAQADGRFHSSATGGRGDTGGWLLIVAAADDTPDTRTHLRDYLAAKKHQDGAERALGVLLNHDGSPRLTLWYDHPPEPDPELDRLAGEMRLVPPDRMPRVLPPHVRQPGPRAAAR